MITEEVNKSNKTARAAGAVGKNAVVPRAVRLWLAGQDNASFMRILDFGCGPAMLHVNQLRGEGLDVVGTDFGKNLDMAKMVQVEEVENQIDVAYASNVFNTHSNKLMSHDALANLFVAIKPNGFLFYNLPQSPNFFWKNNEGIKEFNKLVYAIFGNKPVKFRHPFLGASTPVWTVQKHPDLF